ncbi:hypothetical protein [Staphylococcus equorum]|uniref:hypothetical protein n=1 Tax=Staphylococcus equorum TaxID=246432 RepID=UPI00192D1644|nr:hypothetical protein [Staphylococcus equorum]
MENKSNKEPVNKKLQDEIDKHNAKHHELGSVEKDWRDNLPKGFEPIFQYSRPAISFDAKHNRFYMSASLLKALDLRKGSRISMAYNKAEDTLLIVTSGSTLFIDTGSYVTSSHFASKTGLKTGQHYYEYIDEDSSDEFKVLRYRDSKYD